LIKKRVILIPEIESLMSLFGTKFTQLTCQYSNGIGEVQARSEVWVHVKVPSHHLSCKSSAALQLFKQSTALLQTIDCRKVWGKQLTGTEQGRLHSLFGMKFTQVPSQYSNRIREVQARNEVWVCVKAPSRHLSCKSSTALQLFKQSTALLQTIDCRKVCGKQPT
jgi:uncharacterized protein (UPF0276 family)